MNLRKLFNTIICIITFGCSFVGIAMQQELALHKKYPIFSKRVFDLARERADQFKEQKIPNELKEFSENAREKIYKSLMPYFVNLAEKKKVTQEDATKDAELFVVAINNIINPAYNKRRDEITFFDVSPYQKKAEESFKESTNREDLRQRYNSLIDLLKQDIQKRNLENEMAKKAKNNAIDSMIWPIYTYWFGCHKE